MILLLYCCLLKFSFVPEARSFPGIQNWFVMSRGRKRKNEKFVDLVEECPAAPHDNSLHKHRPMRRIYTRALSLETPEDRVQTSPVHTALLYWPGTEHTHTRTVCLNITADMKVLGDTVHFNTLKNLPSFLNTCASQSSRIAPQSTTTSLSFLPSSWHWCP